MEFSPSYNLIEHVMEKPFLQLSIVCFGFGCGYDYKA